MKKGTRVLKLVQASSLFGEDPLADAVRGEIRSVIERVLAEELASTLGAGPYAREEGRSRYRHGSEERTLATSWGPADHRKPRALNLECCAG